MSILHYGTWVQFFADGKERTGYVLSRLQGAQYSIMSEQMTFTVSSTDIIAHSE